MKKSSAVADLPLASSRPTRDAVADRAFLCSLLRTDFMSFTHKCFQTLTPGARFQPNWHLEAIAHHLELVRRGRLKRLIINLPPRSLKSIFSSVAFPAFMLGHDPTQRIIVVSYASDLAVKHSNDFRAIISSEWYAQIFPGTVISRNKNTETEVVTTKMGFRLATSTDGTLTGRGGNIIVLDDPQKPLDALSDSKRQRVNDWFFNTLLSRLNDKENDAIVVVMQRLHIDDLTGRLLQDPGRWTVLSLPVIAEQEERIAVGDNRYHVRQVGDLLHPERESLRVIEEIRAQLGTGLFSAQYQQAPVPPGGAMIKTAWVRRYDHLPSASGTRRVVQSWDTASKTGPDNDWSVCTTWFFVDKHFYLLDVLRGRWDYPTLKARAIDYARRHRAQKILVEDAGVGTALIPELRKAGFAVKEVRPEHNKEARISTQSAKIESGFMLLPKQAPWLEQLEAELFSFPHSRHDDQVDSISQALAHAASGYDSSMSWV
jgi:predicted phage terminase large subunit-like protein